MLFDECEHGKSLIQLAKVINGMGVKPRYGKVWHESAIRKILTNKTYYGALEYSTKKGGEVLIENHHQPLITYEQYEKCRSIMSSRSRKKGFAAKSYTRKHTHIFAGLVTCGYCGGHLVAQLDKARREGDYRPSYYICTGRRNLKICKNKLAQMLRCSDRRQAPTSVYMWKRFEYRLSSGMRWRSPTARSRWFLWHRTPLIHSGSFV